MSFQAMEWALGARVGKSTGKGILLVLAHYADDEGEVRVQVGQVAREACCHMTCASNWIRNLSERGFLEKRRVGGGETSGLFIKLNMDNETNKENVR